MPSLDIVQIERILTYGDQAEMDELNQSPQDRAQQDREYVEISHPTPGMPADRSSVPTSNRPSQSSTSSEPGEPTAEELEAIEAEIDLEEVASDADMLKALLEDEELDSIEAEIGLRQVEVDPDTLNTVTVDDTENTLDTNDDGVIDAAERNVPEVISDLPIEETESYGTGLQGQPTDRAGRRAHLSETQKFNEASPVLTGGDIDANYYQADAVGDEAVGGTVATPDQDIVDELGAAVGLEMDDRTFLRTNDTLEERDDRRWELDPQSSEDYPDRRE